jgi:hypothetical protein
MKGIDIIASDVKHSRKISIQGKTKRSGTWHANVARDAHRHKEDPLEEKFWIFVHLGGEEPVYYIAPPLVGEERHSQAPHRPSQEARRPASERRRRPRSRDPGVPHGTVARWL